MKTTKEYRDSIRAEIRKAREYVSIGWEQKVLLTPTEASELLDDIDELTNIILESVRPIMVSIDVDEESGTKTFKEVDREEFRRQLALDRGINFGKIMYEKKGLP